MEIQHLKNILESCLLVAGKAMSINQLEKLFDADIDRPERSEIKDALHALKTDYEGRGIELVEVASGWRLQSRAEMEHWVSRLFQEKSPRYSRALLETLVLIAYRQPITRGEIEEVRGVAVSSNIIKTLQEREWVKEIGYKDVPGKPALWGTTRQFLDYFNLKRLDELPTLAEAQDLEAVEAALVADGTINPITEPEAANEADIAKSTENERLNESITDDTATSETEGSANETSATKSNAFDDETHAQSDVSQDNEPSDTINQEKVNESVETANGDSSEDVSPATDDMDLAQLASNLTGNDLPSMKEQLNDVVSQFIESNDTENPEQGESGKGAPESFHSAKQSAVAMSRTQAELMADVAVLDNENSDHAAESSEPQPSKALGELHKVINEFAEEHQKELEARQQIEDLQASGNHDHSDQPKSDTIALYGASGVVQSENIKDINNDSDDDDHTSHPKNSEP